jgi:hypothetical protein
MQTHATKQIGGKGARHSGTMERARIAEELRLELVDVGNTGRSLDPKEFPGVGAKFSLRDVRTYQALRATAEAYLEAIGPIKAAFVEREYPPDFDEQIAQLIADFDAASRDQDAGLQEQSSGTAGLRVVSSRALAAVRELDAMITKRLRKSDPALLQVWKQTKHVERPPKKGKAELQAPLVESGGVRVEGRLSAGASGEVEALVTNRDDAGTSAVLNGREAESAEVRLVGEQPRAGFERNASRGKFGDGFGLR